MSLKSVENRLRENQRFKLPLSLRSHAGNQDNDFEETNDGFTFK